ncbi:hypothetical protein PHLGIDRAFT_323809 [Phlebiopsis gigantea 11061_1 CR5-6]|uniref:Uncharacterized protein n=1 Tax=Phlebiopsis gigantea (strain 11061_1 CR5-6) TaxID=745531 RepID=A0A0C3SD83_PHLG1|nr:hypothetical protein PHLGIDRAFT_323809 [Phlebiopsis gigantea 11061_1 CR5-6]
MVTIRLSPRTAHAHEILQCFWCAVAGAWTWEVLSNLGEEYDLLTKFKFTCTQLLYVLSRITTTVCVCLALTFLLADVENCDSLFKTTSTLLALAPLFSSMLMFIRLRAIYLNDTRLVYAYLCLWFFSSVTNFGTTIPSFHASHIGTTRRCIISSVHSMAAVGVIINAITDTVYFLAVSYKLLNMRQYGGTWKMRLKSFFGGSERYLSGVRRRGLTHALLRGGQQYYLLTVWMSVATAVLPFCTNLPLDIRILLNVPYVALQNAMMCKVHRQLKLGLIVEYDLDISKLSLNIGVGPPARDVPPTDLPSSNTSHSVDGPPDGYMKNVEMEGLPTDVG